MKILSNATVIKLKENSRSYGAPETIDVAYVVEFENEIQLYSHLGTHSRTMRKGTRVLKSFTGTEITERAFKSRVKKANEAFEIKKAENAKKLEIEIQANKAISNVQLNKWVEILKSNPERAERYFNKIENAPSNNSRSGSWRNWLVMKAAKHINNGKFEGLKASAPDLAEMVYKVRNNKI